MLSILLASLAAAAAAATAPVVAQPVIDNERVSVWDVPLGPGGRAPETRSDLDRVVVFLEGGRIRTAGANGAGVVRRRASGDAVLIPAGMVARDSLVSGGPAHEVVIALKDQAHTAVVNRTGLPPAFPRPGAVKVLETPRLTVWRYSWTPGEPSPMHFHDKDVVVSYRYDGSLKSVTPEGVETVNAYKSGDIRFNRADRAHYELLVTERQSAVMVELK